MAKRLYVGNLSFHVTKDDLTELFSQVGQVETVAIMTDRDTGRSKGFGFVEMVSDHHADQAINQLNGTALRGRSLSVNIDSDTFGNNRGDQGGSRGGGTGGPIPT